MSEHHTSASIAAQMIAMELPFRQDVVQFVFEQLNSVRLTRVYFDSILVGNPIPLDMLKEYRIAEDRGLGYPGSPAMQDLRSRITALEIIRACRDAFSIERIMRRETAHGIPGEMVDLIERIRHSPQPPHPLVGSFHAIISYDRPALRTNRCGPTKWKGRQPIPWSKEPSELFRDSCERLIISFGSLTRMIERLKQDGIL